MTEAWAALTMEEKRWQRINKHIVEKWKHVTFKSQRTYTLNDPPKFQHNIIKQVISLKGHDFARRNHRELYEKYIANSVVQ